MVTQKEYEDFQNNNDRQHPLNPDGTPVSTRVTPQDYTLWQNHWSRDVEIPDDPPARHPSQTEYTRFPNSFGRVSESRSRTQGVLVLESEEYKAAQALRRRQMMENDPEMRELNLEDYKKALEEREKRTQKAIAEMHKRDEERARKKKRIKSSPILKRLSENAYGGKEAQEMRRKKLMMIK